MIEKAAAAPAGVVSAPYRGGRRADRGKVQYGAVWSRLHVEQFSELYDHPGGVDGAAGPLRRKQGDSVSGGAY